MFKSFFIASIYVFSCFILLFTMKKQGKLRNKMSIISMIFISLLFVVVNIICTYASPEYGGDRKNYNIEYLGYRSTSSISLDFLFYIFRNIGLKFETVLYLISFINVFIILCSYNISDNFDYKTYFLFALFGVFFNTFTMLKQAFAFSLATIFFAFFFNNKKYSLIKMLIVSVLASTFHIAALVLFPLIILRYFKIKKSNIYVLITFLLIVFLFFKQILGLSSSLVGIFSPIYASKIDSYIQDMSGFSFVFIKYIPVFYISFLGLLYRKQLCSHISNYDKYLCISIIASFILLTSCYSYWMIRFSVMFYLPVFQFFNIINNNIKYKFDKQFNKIFIYLYGIFYISREIILIFNNNGSL